MPPIEAFEPDRFELFEPPFYRFEITRRQAIGTLAAGWLVTAWVADAQDQPSGERVEARIHLGDDGIFTVFSGKVEEGQGPRTELAMAAAEELGVPLERVRVVLCDTSRTPDDGITAGSRTTPGTVPAVRRAAAAARGWLSREKRLIENPRLREPGEWTILGKGRWRTDAREIVTGAHRFPSDIALEGMLYGCVLRPPAYGARLESVDVEAGKKAGAAAAVRDGDFAGCAARTSYEARRALEAMAATARWSGGQKHSHTNLFEHLRATAKEKVPPLGGRTHSAEYRTAYIQHAPMEPRAAVAEWKDGRLTVWTGTSNPFSVRAELARAFGLRAEEVRVIVPDFGGGFGGKHTGEAALEAARLAKEAGRPVKVRWTREEEFRWAYFRPAALIDAEAVLEGGRIRAWQFTNYNSGAAGLQTPYAIPDRREKYVPADPPLRQGSYRTLAATANHFAREAFMDELAAAAGADPLDFRLAHLENDRIRAVLLAACEKFGWRERRRQKRAAHRGIGLACGTEKNSVVAACVEVEVDPKAKAVRLVEIVEAFECGAILNPWNTRSQVEGCILMGLGAALREEILFDNGRVLNARFSQYRVPRFRDLPDRLEVILLDRKDLPSAGAGETPIVAVAPAMANAIFDATGARPRSLPLRW
ncbi:MAG: molybdopterin-dependent oxidoreductase [Bryobacteraceae bacterium]|nr:molybdopterin-dependent oxidoreductase [Bryobacteraceae bacterium]